MEGAAAAGLVATVPGDFGWNDVGDYRTLADVLSPDEHGNVTIDPDDKADSLVVDSTGLVLVPQAGRLIAALGVHDLIVVDTEDVVLVCPRERSQEVKRLVDVLKERGDSHLL